MRWKVGDRVVTGVKYLHIGCGGLLGTVRDIREPNDALRIGDSDPYADGMVLIEFDSPGNYGRSDAWFPPGDLGSSRAFGIERSTGDSDG